MPPTKEYHGELPIWLSDQWRSTGHYWEPVPQWSPPYVSGQSIQIGQRLRGGDLRPPPLHPGGRGEAGKEMANAAEKAAETRADSGRLQGAEAPKDGGAEDPKEATKSLPTRPRPPQQPWLPVMTPHQPQSVLFRTRSFSGPPKALISWYLGT